MMIKRIKWDAIFVSNEEYSALRTAANRKDRIIYSPPESLSPSSGLCLWSDTVPDGLGGMKSSYKTHLIISDDGIRYVQWRIKQNRMKWVSRLWEAAKFLIPVIISITALIVSSK